MSAEETLPPHEPNTPRTFFRRAWAWLKAHPQFSVPLGAFLAGGLVGFVLGKI